LGAAFSLENIETSWIPFFSPVYPFRGMDIAQIHPTKGKL